MRRLFWLIGLVLTCPDECRCNARKQVYCNNRNLRALPDNIPTDTKVLFLQDNQLTNSQELEEQLAKLNNLERLMFYSNQLEFIPRLNAPNLRELRLNNNRINSIHSDSLSLVPNLSELILDGNSLTNAGIHRGAFDKLNNLKRVSFTNNFLTEFPMNLPSTLNHIFLSDNQLSYVSFESLAQLSNLETLYLNRNRLSDGSFEHSALSSLNRLREFEISYNLLNHVPHDLQPSLEKLHMTSNKIEFIRSDEFETLTQLRNIDLAYNRLRAIEHGTLDRLVSLDRIDLSGNNWNCDCNLKSLKIFLNNNGVHRGVREPVMCGDSDHVGTKLDFIHEDSLQCDVVTFNITTDENGVSIETRQPKGIIPPFGEHVIRAEEVTQFGLNQTTKIMIKPPMRVQLNELKAGTEYRICVYNQYDELAGGVVPERYCTSFKTSETLVTVKGASHGASENIIGIALGMLAILVIVCVIILFILRRRLTCFNTEKDIITPGHSLDKTYRLYQVPAQSPYSPGTTPAMTLDASKEFNVTLMLRQDQQPTHTMINGKKFAQKEYNQNRDSGIYSNMRNNSLSGSTTTGSEDTDKTLLESSRTDLGIYL